MQSKMWIVPAIGLFATLSAQVAAQDGVDEADEVIGAVEAVPEEFPDDAPEPPGLMITTAESGRGWGTAKPLDYPSWGLAPADYPAELWNEGYEGATAFKVIVDIEGKPSSCEVIVSSGNEILDRLACSKMIERASFQPAVDDDGKPVEGFYVDNHYWEKQEPQWPGNGTIKMRLDVDRNGQAQGCEIDITGQIEASLLRDIERNPCPAALRGGAPFRDESGVPVAKSVTVEMKVTVEDVPE